MTVNTVSEVQTTQKEPEHQQGISTLAVTQVVWLSLSIFEALLALRFFLKLNGVKPVSPIVAVVYGLTGLFRLRIFQF